MESVSVLFIDHVLSILPLKSFKFLRNSPSNWGKIAQGAHDKREIASVTVNLATCEVSADKRPVLSDERTPIRANEPQDYGRFVKLGNLSFTNKKLAAGIRYELHGILNLVSLEASVDGSSRVRLDGISQPALFENLKSNFREIEIRTTTNLHEEIADFLWKAAASHVCSVVWISNYEMTARAFDAIFEIAAQKQAYKIEVDFAYVDEDEEEEESEEDDEPVFISVAQTRAFIDKWIADPCNFGRHKTLKYPHDDYEAHCNSLIENLGTQLSVTESDCGTGHSFQACVHPVHDAYTLKIDVYLELCELRFVYRGPFLR